MGKSRNKTLSCFVAALRGVQVIVELRYDTVLRGLLESTDDALNLVLTGVTVQPLQACPILHTRLPTKTSERQVSLTKQLVSSIC